MASGDVKRSPGDSPTADVAYLSRADHRIPALVALSERPRSRAELCELTGVSSSTIRRTLDGFEARTWIRKDGYQFVATRLGETVADGMETLLDRLETERTLRAVWRWLPEAVGEFSVETWAAMTVTVADPDAPYRPVSRFESLLSGTSELRYLRPEVALMEPCFETLPSLLDAGGEITVIDRPNCHAYFVSTYPERCAALLEREAFSVLEHDDLPPYGVGLLDDRTVISCYEPGSGAVAAVIDTDAPPVREWATSVFDRHRADARRFDPRPIGE
ncbi:helix-turn-helix transcriptional regulator [Halovivax limisalsi]|uniref:helix-turn-helix transcriptional regulator n=1 Tax=Halovivax limisalsi TaxID=1453760 RepID=UPI001FFC820A|nr:MarR family transcriptional regulator [Halovivax limisalsi]